MNEAYLTVCRLRGDIETFMQDLLFDNLCLDAQNLVEEAFSKLDEAKSAQSYMEDS